MLRVFALLCGLLAISACTNPNDLDKAPAYMGNFHLGHNVVVAPNLTKGPASREASKEEWIAEMKAAIAERFGRYDGTKLYHLGISVEGYVLAVPGVPIVASPKSALILNLTVWDDAAGKKLNDKPHTVTVIESLSGNTILGSGLTQSREMQMHNLTRNAAKQIQTWLAQQNYDHGWFEDDGVPLSEKGGGLFGGTPAAADDAAETTEGGEGAEGAAGAEVTPTAAAQAEAAATVIEEPEVAPATEAANSDG